VNKREWKRKDEIGLKDLAKERTSTKGGYDQKKTKYNCKSEEAQKVAGRETPGCKKKELTRITRIIFNGEKLGPNSHTNKPRETSVSWGERRTREVKRVF